MTLSKDKPRAGSFWCFNVENTILSSTQFIFIEYEVLKIRFNGSLIILYKIFLKHHLNVCRPLNNASLGIFLVQSGQSSELHVAKMTRKSNLQRLNAAQIIDQF